MTLAVGIISIIVALFFLYRTVRLWPPGTYRSQSTRPSTKTDIAAGLFLVAALVVTGVAIISGGSLWWLFVGIGGGLLWAIVNA